MRPRVFGEKAASEAGIRFLATPVCSAGWIWLFCASPVQEKPGARNRIVIDLLDGEDRVFTGKGGRHVQAPSCLNQSVFSTVWAVKLPSFHALPGMHSLVECNGSREGKCDRIGLQPSKKVPGHPRTVIGHDSRELLA